MTLGEIYDIEIDKIKVSNDNVRHRTPDKEDIEELAASIKKHGLLQPVVLLGEYGNGKGPYKLISGQRRLLAHQFLGKTTIRAVFAGKLTHTQAIIRSLVENLQRVDLDYQDTSRAITDLYKTLGDEYAIKKETGLSIRTIRDYIRIEAQATSKIRAMLKAKKVSPADVKRALRAAQDNITKAEDLLDLIVKYRPTTYQKRRLVEYGERDKNASADHIMREALKPHIEENIVVTLPPEIREALIAATKKLQMEPEELASKILRDWLREQGFVG